MKKIFGKRMIASVLALVMAMALAACGSGSAQKPEDKPAEAAAEAPADAAAEPADAAAEPADAAAEPADAAAETPAETTAENPADLKEITLVLDWTPNTNHTGFYVAQAQGYFAEAGLKVNIIQPPEDGAVMMVASGNAEFCIDFQDYLAPVFASKDTFPVTAVAALIQHNTSGIISLKEDGIDTPKGLEGKNYATWDAERAGLDTNMIYFKDITPEFDYYSPVIVANTDFLSSDPETAKAFLAAAAKGYEFAINDPEAAAKILCEQVPELDPEMVAESQQWLADQYVADASKWGYIDPARWDAFYAWLYNNGLSEEIPAGTGFTNDYLPE